ncbi:hypothetical protein BT96DRAFT_945264 [Gymnopus androsaceus JB14]|uniref:Uncharacterized protein n=1 Tax=Gymnopus androsaceus JB14 TaxID=1447944 RepID=A0A6A4H023_9AGAR|nr:hypothetical protein BT96DRAFT_945264 [Gymnopus androsaceus JB14]
MTNVYNLWVPMPIPRTRDAPHFNGQYIGDFLNCIIQHGAYAGITNADNLVNYIVEYSSDKVKDLILYMAEFDPDVTGKIWNNAKAALYRLYGTIDKPKEYTEEEMISFCRDQSAKSAFTKSSEIEAYYRAFIPIAVSLKKQDLIMDNQFNLYFVEGLPGLMKDWFASAIPQVNCTKYNPPTVTVTLAVLKAKFNKDSTVYKDWKHTDENKAKSEFDDIGNRVTVLTFQEDIVVEPATPGSSAVMPTHNNVQRKPTNIDKITRKLDALTLAVQNQRAPPRQNQGNGQDLPRVPFGWNGGVSLYLQQNRTANTTNRFNPINRPEKAAERTPARPVAPKATPNPSPQPLPQLVQQQQTQPHKEVHFDTELTPAPSRVNIPQPPNPINNERGWKGSRPGNLYEGDQEVLASIVGTRGPALTEHRVFVEKGDPDLEEFVFRCSNAAAQIPQTCFFAMTVGDVKLTINGTEFLAMIDSGSELNIASFNIPERGSLPMDFDGMKWKLKGINGDFEQLQGYVLDAKMCIGGHNFSHHVFIS